MVIRRGGFFDLPSKNISLCFLISLANSVSVVIGEFNLLVESTARLFYDVFSKLKIFLYTFARNN